MVDNMNVNIIEKEKEGGYYVITSPDVPGLLLCSKDRKAIWADIPQSIELLNKLNKHMNDLHKTALFRERQIKFSKMWHKPIKLWYEFWRVW